MPLKLTDVGFAAADPAVATKASTITLLVGPNNSGKSLALRELDSWAGGQTGVRQVLGRIAVEWPADATEAETLLSVFQMPIDPGESAPPDAIKVQPFSPALTSAPGATFVQRSVLRNALVTPEPNESFLLQSLLRPFTVYLNGRARFSLMDPRPIQDLQLPPQHHLAALYKDDQLREEVREIVQRAFPGSYFVIDATGMSTFRVRMSPRPPADVTEEQGWDVRPRAFHEAATPVEAMSDGVVSFSGLIAAALSLPYRLLLVDEPEAFLHPPLARLLGTSLANLVSLQQANLVAATHSPEFLMGCIDSGADTTIVRLTWEAGVAGARVLAPTALQDLIKDPLLRSMKALDGGCPGARRTLR